MLWWIMIALIGLLAGGSAGQVTAAAFYSMGDTKTPTTLFIFTFTIYIPIKVLMFRQYGLVGLALTISAHLVINFLVQLIALERATSLRHPARANNYT
jgi:putative peptidoglycan lipid II flippase